eukprot:CAMPEP_0181110086 /NCGR_PEP_ID=MMETSP1071-20121207/18527_1 /TAXON_ID=35127 /ORGANISM="Thalassiosira sp., Strain NH16" /LENGTH=873 /DNA_ID=CAMNT_0023193835 /DNA_START=54 /DNA_END=2675 /DNA_ORIENTATION=+
MFPVGSGAMPHSLPDLPNGWTAYTDVGTSRTYYVHHPSGDTQWTRPCPRLSPPHPPRDPRQNLPQQPPPSQIYSTIHNQPYQSYSMTPTTPMAPHDVQNQSHNYNSQGMMPTTPHGVQNQSHNYNSQGNTPTNSHSVQNQSHHYNSQGNTPMNPHGVQNQSHHYSNTPTNPHSVQNQSHHYNSQGTFSNGWNNSRQSYNPSFNQNNFLPPPPTLSHHAHNQHWQSKRLRPPSNPYHPPMKRPRVHHTPIIEANKRECSKCGLMKGWAAFSKRQWTCFDAMRKCKSCVDEAVKANELSQAATTNPLSRKGCSACGEKLVLESFSKRQWASRDDIRKCKTCVDKFLVEEQAKADAAKADAVKTDAAKADAVKADVAKKKPDQSGDKVIDSAKGQGSSIDETKKHLSKVCSSCGELRLWGSFSKRQWTTRADLRKCKLCMDKFLAQDGQEATSKESKAESQLEQPKDKASGSVRGNQVSVNENSHIEDKSQAVNLAESEGTIQDIAPSKAIDSAKDDDVSEGKISHVENKSQAGIVAGSGGVIQDNNPAEAIESVKEDELSIEKSCHVKDKSQAASVPGWQGIVQDSTPAEAIESAEEDELSVRKIGHAEDECQAINVAESKNTVQDCTLAKAIESAKEDEVSEGKIRHIGDKSQAADVAGTEATVQNSSPAEAIETAKKDKVWEGKISHFGDKSLAVNGAEYGSTNQDIDFAEDILSVKLDEVSAEKNCHVADKSQAVNGAEFEVGVLDSAPTKGIELSREEAVSVNKNSRGDDKPQADDCADVESTSKEMMATPDCVVSENSQGLLDDKPTGGEDTAEMPLKFCSRCKKELSKSSYKRWGKWRCDSCVIRPIVKVEDRSINTDGQVVIKEESDS